MRTELRPELVLSPRESSTTWAILLALSWLVALGSCECQAATITVTHTRQCKLTLSGTIEATDVALLRSAFDDPRFSSRLKGEDPVGDAAATLCLNSLGGSYITGVEMAKIVSEYGVTTVIDENMNCLSACALIFMAGRTWGAESDNISRWLNVRGHLGFHAPYLELPSDRESYRRSDVQKYYGAAIQAIAKFLELANQNSYFQDGSRVRASLIQEMLYRGKDDLFYIDSVDKVGRWGISLFGYSAPTLNKETAWHACMNALAWRADTYAFSETSDQTPKLDMVTLKSSKIAETMYDVQEGGMDPYGCDVYVNKDSGATLVCGYSDSGDYGHGCGNSDTEMGWSVEPYFLLSPNSELSKLPPGDVPSWAFGAESNSHAPTGQEQPSAFQASVGSKAFTIFEMRDAYGHDYSTIRDLKLEECQSMCSTGERCKAYTYDRWNRVCILKDGVGPLRLEPRSVAGVLSAEPTVLSSGAETIQGHKSKRFPNSGYLRLAVAIYDACAKVCLSDGRCAAFNYETKSKACVLIAKPEEYADSKTTDIGIKEQSP